MAYTTVNVTGTVALTTLVASAPDKQLVIKSITIAVAKTEAGKMIQIKTADGAVFFQASLGTGQVNLFKPATEKGEYYSLPAAKALQYSSSGTNGAIDASIVVNWSLQ